MNETQNNTTSGFLALMWRRVKSVGSAVWLIILYIFDRTLDALARDVIIVQREADVFFGTFLLLVGLFGFESGRYCDGNVGDYISCTRPATFYYFDTLDIVLVVLGVFFVLFWYFKHEHNSRATPKK